MNWSKWVRQTHRCVSIAFSAGVIVNIAAVQRVACIPTKSVVTYAAPAALRDKLVSNSLRRPSSMTYYGAKELARSFRTVRENTIQVAEDIPEDRYGFRPAEGCRSVEETLAHIAIMPRVPKQIHFIEHRSTLVGFDFFGLMGKLKTETQTPRTKAQILDLLRSEGEKYAKALDGVSEAFLGEQVEYPEGMEPRIKSRFEMLTATKEHEMHHRGQLMVIERMVGITPHLTRRMQAVIAAAQAGR